MTARESMQPLVLKIGGSLVTTGIAHNVLAMAVASKRPVAIVPGGGAFADAVRAAQSEQGFDDATAHRLAIQAMHDMAAEFQDMQPGLMAVDSQAGFDEAWKQDRTPVWLPWPMVAHEPSIPQNWSITSDSLAAWLAGQLPGADVALVKSCVVPRDASLQALVAAGITDPQFPAFVAREGLSWHVLGEGDEARLARVLGLDAPDLGSASLSI